MVYCYGYTAGNVLIKRAAANVGDFLYFGVFFLWLCDNVVKVNIVVFAILIQCAERVEVDFRVGVTACRVCVAGEDFERDCCRVACRALALTPCAAVPCAGGAGGDYVNLCEFLFVVLGCYEFKPRNTTIAAFSVLDVKTIYEASGAAVVEYARRR